MAKKSLKKQMCEKEGAGMSQAQLEEVMLNLTPAFAEKLLTGKPVMMSKTRLKKGGVPIFLKPEHVKKITQARMKGRGCKMCLDDQELEGSGILDWLKKAGKTAAKLAKAGAKVYREDIRPVVGSKVKKAVRGAVDKGTDALAVAFPKVGVPLNVLDEKYGDRVVDWAGRKAGLWTEGQGFAMGGGYGMMPAVMPAGMGFAYGGRGVEMLAPMGSHPPMTSWAYLPYTHQAVQDVPTYRGYSAPNSAMNSFVD